MRCLVACTFDETIASFSPRKSFNKVLLPALGLPKIFTKPAFKSLWFVVCSLLKCPIEFLQYKSATQWKPYAYSSAGLKIIQIKKSCFMTGPLPCCEGGKSTRNFKDLYQLIFNMIYTRHFINIIFSHSILLTFLLTFFHFFEIFLPTNQNIYSGFSCSGVIFSINLSIMLCNTLLC